ncbi:TPA: hypothetical protein ACOVJJ_004502 [Klebsiella oxytoca]
MFFIPMWIRRDDSKSDASAVDHSEVSLTSDIMENLRGVYLPPLRDVAQGLRPNRNSLLTRLLHLLTDEAGRDTINIALTDLDDTLKQNKSIQNTHKAISTRHDSIMGNQLVQKLTVGFSVTDFLYLSSLLTLMAEAMEIEKNGLGFNNLIFMAVVLSELAKILALDLEG